MAKEIIFLLNAVQESQESQQFSLKEFDLCKELKLKLLGLASLKRTVARQRSHKDKEQMLATEGTNTRYFHIHVCHRHHKKHVVTIAYDNVSP